MIVPELKFAQVALKMLLAAKAIGSFDRTLEIAEEIFNGICGLAVITNIEAVAFV